MCVPRWAHTHGAQNEAEAPEEELRPGRGPGKSTGSSLGLDCDSDARPSASSLCEP